MAVTRQTFDDVSVESLLEMVQFADGDGRVFCFFLIEVSAHFAIFPVLGT